MQENNITKELIVKTGARGNQSIEIVKLAGIAPDAKLTPKLAAQAARIHPGHRSGVTVLDGVVGYRLYTKSARKIYLEV